MCVNYPMRGGGSGRTNHLTTPSPVGPLSTERWQIPSSGNIILIEGVIYKVGSGNTRLFGYQLEDGKNQFVYDSSMDLNNCSLAGSGDLVHLSGQKNIETINAETGRQKIYYEDTSPPPTIQGISILPTETDLFAVAVRDDMMETGQHLKEHLVTYADYTKACSTTAVDADMDMKPTLVGHDNRVYVSVHGIGDNTGALIGYTDGVEEWRTEFDKEESVRDVAAGNEMLYALIRSVDAPSTALGVNRETGVKMWETELPGPPQAMAVTADMLFTTLLGDGIVSINNKTGEVLSREYDYNPYVRSEVSPKGVAPTVVGDTAYIYEQSRGKQYLTAIDVADGSKQWNYELSVSPIQAPIVADSICIVAGEEKIVGLEAGPSTGGSQSRSGPESNQTSENASFCENCGEMIDSDANFCANCGTKIAICCPSCGTDLEGDESFCPECGTSVSN